MRVIDKLSEREDMIAPGVSACAGCNVELTLRTMTKILGLNTILTVPPGCANRCAQPLQRRNRFQK